MSFGKGSIVEVIKLTEKLNSVEGLLHIGCVGVVMSEGMHGDIPFPYTQVSFGLRSFYFWNRELKLYNNETKKEKQMQSEKIQDTSRGLFEIHAISLKDDSIVFEQKVIADGETGALYESDLKAALKEKGLTKDDVHIVVNEIGTVPARPRPQMVKLLDKVCNFVKGG